jgi:hypothetical protein
MKLRRVAISIAATTALALGGAATAFADAHFVDHNKNLTTCEAAGLTGEILIDDGNPSVEGLSGVVSDGKYLNVTVDSELWDVSGTVVKGGPNSRVYPGDPVADMHSPDHPDEGKTPDISHWYVCGKEADPKDPDPKDPDPKDPDPKDPDPKDPEPDKTPAPVPTEVPAGYGDTGSGVAGTVGLLGAFAAAVAAGALLIRRRLLNEN